MPADTTKCSEKRRKSAIAATTNLTRQTKELEESDEWFIIAKDRLAAAHTGLSEEGAAPLDVVKAMGWDTRGQHKNARTMDNEPESDADRKAWAVGVRAVGNFVERVSRIFFPNHGEEVLKSILEQKLRN